jgi:multidrug resistance efflux pump
MNRNVLLSVTLASIMVVVSSCSSGIPQELYKKATDDLSSAQSQSQSLQAQLSSAQSQSQSLQTQINSLQAQSQSLQSDLKSATDKLTKAKILFDLINSLMQVGISGSTMTTSQLANTYIQWSNSVKSIGDATLSAKFDALINSSTSAKQDAASEDFALYLFGLGTKLLQ